MSPTPSPPAAGLGEGRIDETLVEAEPLTVFHQLGRITHDVLEDTLARPECEVLVHGTLGPQLTRQVLPLGTVVEYQEDATQRRAFVPWRAVRPWQTPTHRAPAPPTIPTVHP